MVVFMNKDDMVDRQIEPDSREMEKAFADLYPVCVPRTSFALIS
jgi:hypothetical protein